MRCVKNANKQKLFSLCSRREKLETRKCDTFPNKNSKLRLVFTRDLNLNDQSFFCSCYLRMCQCSNYFSIVSFLIWLILLAENLALFPHSHATFQLRCLWPFLPTFPADFYLFLLPQGCHCQVYRKLLVLYTYVYFSCAYNPMLLSSH